MNSLLYSIAMNYSRPKKKPFPFELVEELAAEKPCIIIGRCAGYLTREQDNAFSVFIHADMDKRIAAVMARDHINSHLKAKRKIEEIDENAVLSARNSPVKNGDSPNTTTCPLTPLI